jgi:hypothetical protein
MVGIAAEADPSAAFAQMSTLVGYEVAPPTYLPDGNRITRVSAIARGGDARRSPYVQTFVVGDNGGFLLSIFRSPQLDLDGFEPALVTQVKGAEAWVAHQPEGSVYLVTKGDKAFTIALRATSKLSEDEFVKVIEGLR